VQPVERSVAAAPGVPSPATPPPLPPSRRPGFASLPQSAPRQNVEPWCAQAATATSLICGPWCTVALCTRHAPSATGHARPGVQQSSTGGERQSTAQTEHALSRETEHLHVVNCLQLPQKLAHSDLWRVSAEQHVS
jgi:hypothetical protein